MQGLARVLPSLAIATASAGLMTGDRLAAQGLSVTPFAGADAGAAGSPPRVGLTATYWTGPVGWRIGGAMDLSSSAVSPVVPHPMTT